MILKRVGAAAEPWETFEEAYAYCKHHDHLYFIEVEMPEDPFEEPKEGPLTTNACQIDDAKSSSFIS